MKIVNLIENTKGREGCLSEHGLSFYLETGRHRLLVDTGASGAFMENARVLGIDLSQVDLVILSHGHYDHAGGILEFAKMNPRAEILLRKNALDAYYHRNGQTERYIGMDSRIGGLSCLRFVGGDEWIDSGLFLFSGVGQRRLWPEGNLELARKQGETYAQDDFSHEQYLAVTEGGKKVLISGCAHNGILNILDRYREILKEDPDAVISGFHMQKKTEYSEQDMEVIRQTALELKRMETVFYTGHCTGRIPYETMKAVMGDQLRYFHSGEEIVL